MRLWRGTMARMRPAVFLDRDGVMTVEEKKILLPSEIRLYANTIDSIRRLKDHGYFVLVISNQSGVARNLFAESELIELNEKLMQETGVDGIYYCPHHPEGVVPEYAITCNCRKPKTGLIQRACEDFSINLKESWIVGDKETDVLTGKAAGIKTILVMTGYGKDEISRGITANIIAEDISDAVDKIILSSCED